MAVAKRLRDYFFQATVEKSPRGKSVRFLKNSDPNEDTFRNWGASFLNILEDFATTTVAGIFARGTSAEIQSRTRTKTIDSVAYPIAVDPDQLPTIVGGTNVTVSSALNGNKMEYTVNVPAAGSPLVSTDASLEGDGTASNTLKIARQGANTNYILYWEDVLLRWRTDKIDRLVSAETPLEAPDLSANNTIVVRLIDGTAEGQVLNWNGSNWVVSNNTPADEGDVLVWDDTAKEYVPTALSLPTDSGWTNWTSTNAGGPTTTLAWNHAQYRTIGNTTFIRGNFDIGGSSLGANQQIILGELPVSATPAGAAGTYDIARGNFAVQGTSRGEIQVIPASAASIGNDVNGNAMVGQKVVLQAGASSIGTGGGGGYYFYIVFNNG